MISTAALRRGVATVHVGESELGHILVDPNGRTLYAFTNDPPDASTCDGPCAEAWPPVPGEVSVATDVSDQAEVRTIERSDGSTQLAVGNWPLYLFSGDAVPGELNGQGSGGVWFAVAPDGSLKR
jgi:predicted lipoprotein with Yx(FWY)xxD motif